jgi:hypothetical protein
MTHECQAAPTTERSGNQLHRLRHFRVAEMVGSARQARSTTSENQPPCGPSVRALTVTQLGAYRNDLNWWASRSLVG